jgi:hypothetical protein
VDGVLQVGLNENGTDNELQITATSVADRSKTGTAKVVVTKATVRGVIVTPDVITIPKGGKQTFAATIQGIASPYVTWEVTGATSVNTAISTLGSLTIGSDEESKTLTVRAVSEADTEKFGTAIITVGEPTSTGNVKYGDLNKDGFINTEDLRLMLLYFSRPGVAIDLTAADVKYDAVVNYTDLVHFFKYFAQQNIPLGPQA